MINWMCRSHLRARQSPSHKIIMASKWIINFFLLFTQKCSFAAAYHLEDEEKKNKKKIYVKMLKAIVKKKTNEKQPLSSEIVSFLKMILLICIH